MSVDTLTFPNDHTPLDLLLFRRYGEVPGLVEATLAQDPGLADLGGYPPAGASVRVTVPTPASRKIVRKSIRLYD